VFSDAASVFIGEDVYFDDIYPQHIFVGKNVIITSGARILTHFLDTHFAPQPERPFRFYHDNVRIEDGVFIGMNAIISKGCTIGKNAVIGAGSVVTKDIPADAVAGGVPARIIRYKPQHS
jgi:maltose O-acetyltransferase